MVALASQYGRYGYRRVTAVLGTAGWHVGKDRVARIWRREGLKVPQRQKPRRRLWLNDGSCGRLRPLQANHVWSCDFVSTRTHDGRTVRLLTLIDEYTRECLAIRVARRLGSDEVIDVLADVMVTRGIPDHVRSDNSPEFIALRLRQWLADVSAQTLYIEPGSPWENGYCESFNSKLRDEFLNGEIFYSLKEAQILTERWRVHYNTVRPHSSLGYRPPAPMAYRLAMPPELDPVWWTRSERWIRCPEWQQPHVGGHAGNSVTSSGLGRSGWCWKRGRRSAPSPASWILPNRPCGNGSSGRAPTAAGAVPV